MSEKDTPESIIETEYKLWRKNIPYLYDLVYTNVLPFTSPTIQWFPDVERVNNSTTYQRLLTATYTNGDQQEEMIISRVGFPDVVDEDVINNAEITYASSQIIPVPAEINKARYCPHAPNIIACKSESKDIFIYDYTKHSSYGSEAPPDLTLTGHSDGGYAIDWNPNSFGKLVSGGRDNCILLFDINNGLTNSYYSTHTDIVNDLSFNSFNPNIFASASDDKKLCITDIRSATEFISLSNAHASSIEAVDFSPNKSELIVTGSSDCTVKVWDKRCIQTPLAVLRGHKNDVGAVKWSPHYESILGSGSKDRRVILWDLNKSDIHSGDESPEILFIHGGHTSGIEDFDWNPAEPMEICSCGTDGVMNIWRVPVEEYI